MLDAIPDKLAKKFEQGLTKVKEKEKDFTIPRKVKDNDRGIER